MSKLNNYSEALVTYRKQGGLPQGEVKNKLADIYEEMWPQNKHWGASKIDRSCPSCISDMMKSLCAEFEKSLKVHKFPKSKTIDVKKEEKRTEKELEQIWDRMKEDTEDIKPGKLKWGELRKYATSKGVNTKGKTKAEILAELND